MDNEPSKTSQTSGLTRGQTFLASFFLLSWLFLFAGGITMDTSRFRCTISRGGATALAVEGRPRDAAAQDICKDADFWTPQLLSHHTTKLLLSWVAVLLFFLPLNLAMVSSAAGALGALGNKANLEDDGALQDSRDHSSPIVSGLLRGLFVYLFFISGLMLFDDKPFSSPGPGQYIRLAGFISLFSFLVNYRPRLFTTISDWAFDRINLRNRQDRDVTLTEKREIRQEREIKIPVEQVNMNGNEPTPSVPASVPK